MALSPMPQKGTHKKGIILSNVFGPECNCPHYGEGILGYGPDDAEVMAIGIAPGRTEIKVGKPFQGPAGKRFDDVLQVCGFDRSRVYCSNLICWHNDSPTFEEIALCWPRLREEIETRKPKLILALGALASEWLTGFKVGKVRGGIIAYEDLAPTAKLRDFEIAEEVRCRLQGSEVINATAPEPRQLWVMPCWHPAATLSGRNPALVGDLVRDYRKIPRFLAGELSPIPFRQHEITSRKEAQQILHWLSGRVAALDVETTFDTPTSWGKLLCLSISTYIKPREYLYQGNRLFDDYYISYYFPREFLDDLDWPGSIRDGVRREGTLWGFHSGPFDRNVLRRELGVDLPIIWDSMYDSYSCDERPGYDRDDRAGGVGGAGSGRNKAIGPGYHNLDQLAREYCGAGFFKDATKDWIGVDPSNWVSPGSEDQAAVMAGRWASLRDRNALDAAYTMALPSRLPRGQSAPCYSTILLPAANAYSDVSRTGIRIDVDRLRELESTWSAERSSMEKHLEEWAADLGYTNPPKRKRDTEGEPFNPASTTQLAKLLFGARPGPGEGGEAGFAGLGVRSRVKTKKGKPSTSEEALQEIDHPFVLELMRLRKYANTLKYLPMIRTHLRPDGRVHPTFLPLVTGRYSALDPAMQTFPQPYKLAADGVPELAVLRSIIIPSEGHVLVETDYEQIEIWVAALLSGDSVMLADLTAPFEGGKPNYHSNVTRNVLKCEEEVGSDVWERTRRGAKVFTFGIEFGEGPEGLAKHASKEMDTKMGAHAAARIIKDWYDRYAVFAEWQRNQVRTARKQGYLENPFGFVRRFPFPDDVFKNQMYNSAIQGTASQHGTIALVELVDPMYFGLPYPRFHQDGLDEAGIAHGYGGSRLPFELGGYEPLRRAVGGNVLLSIHDSIVCEIPEDKVESGIAHIEQVMSHPRVPGWPGMRVESKVGADWFSMKSVKR